MSQISNELILSTLQEYKKELKSAESQYKYLLSTDELHNCKLHAVHKALIHYKPNKGAKFSTYLCHYFKWEVGDYLDGEIRFRKRHKQTKIQPNLYHESTELKDFEIDTESLIYSDIGYDRIVQDMSFQEIANKHGVSKETARKRFNEFISVLKQKGV